MAEEITSEEALPFASEVTGIDDAVFDGVVEPAVEGAGSAPPVGLPPEQAEALEAGRRRMRGLARHLIGFLAAVVFLVPFSFFYVQNETHNHIGFLMVIGWMGMIIVHVNYAMKPMLGLPSIDTSK